MKVHKALAAAKPAASKAVILAGIVNASADRFVASLDRKQVLRALFSSLASIPLKGGKLHSQITIPILLKNYKRRLKI